MKGGHQLKVIRASGPNFSSFISFKIEVSGKLDSGVGESGIVNSQFLVILVKKGTVLRNGSPPRWREKDVRIFLGMGHGCVLDSEAMGVGQCWLECGMDACTPQDPASNGFRRPEKT